MNTYQWALLAGFAFLAFEIALPATIFLGFAVGAFAVAACSGFGNFPAAVLIVVFAVVSGLAWVALRLIFRRSGDSRPAEGDVNRF